MISLIVILSFICLLAGMAISVYAFGTGGKRAKVFQDIYFSIEDVEGIGIVYTKSGEYSAILRIDNPVQKYSADIDSYYSFTTLLNSILQTLGEGYALHKQDIFVRKRFHQSSEDRQGLNVKRRFLSDAYFKFFEGRPYTSSSTYLVITQEAKKSNFFAYDNSRWRDFRVKIQKVHDQLKDGMVPVEFLGVEEARVYADRFFALNFKDKRFSMTNFKVDGEGFYMGDRQCKMFSLLDVDSLGLPDVLRPYVDMTVNHTVMPVDLMGEIDHLPDVDTVVYNQVIFLPNQVREKRRLEKKRNNCSSLPNPSNKQAVEDINKVLDVLARESKQLVYAHYNLIVVMDKNKDMQKCTNHLENIFSRLGIHISKRAYNQLELFVASFPGNCYRLNHEYDRFLTLGEAALCLMYKEHQTQGDDTPLKCYYTDRQGVPMPIDITGKEGRKQYTNNANFFVLGPSGSGKSFFMNTVCRQL